jgi:hypothetical protein
MRAADRLPLRRVGEGWVAATPWGLTALTFERGGSGAQGTLAVSAQMVWSFSATPMTEKAAAAGAGAR